MHQKEKKETSRGEKRHDKTMMSRKSNETHKINTQHVPFRHIVEEKGRGKGLEALWVHENGRNETVT